MGVGLFNGCLLASILKRWNGQKEEAPHSCSKGWMSNEHPFEWQDNPKWTKYFESVPGLCTNIIFHENSQLTSTGGQPLSCSIAPPTHQTNVQVKGQEAELCACVIFSRLGAEYLKS